MAELVYAHDLKSCLARDVGSIPTPGTDSLKNIQSVLNSFSRKKLNQSKHNPPIAQLVEQIPLKDKVVGSIPTGRTGNLIAYVIEA